MSIGAKFITNEKLQWSVKTTKIRKEQLNETCDSFEGKFIVETA
jgi:hypothetical protein